MNHYRQIFNQLLELKFNILNLQDNDCFIVQIKLLNTALKRLDELATAPQQEFVAGIGQEK